MELRESEAGGQVLSWTFKFLKPAASAAERTGGWLVALLLPVCCLYPAAQDEHGRGRHGRWWAEHGVHQVQETQHRAPSRGRARQKKGDEDESDGGISRQQQALRCGFGASCAGTDARGWCCQLDNLLPPPVHGPRTLNQSLKLGSIPTSKLLCFARAA